MMFITLFFNGIDYPVNLIIGEISQTPVKIRIATVLASQSKDIYAQGTAVPMKQPCQSH